MSNHQPPDNLSISQVRTWLRCPRQHGYRYISGYKEPPTWAMRGGTAMDDALTEHNRGKMQDGKGFNTSALQDYYREQVHRVAEEAELPKGPDMEAVVDDGTKVIPVYMKTLDPAIEPLAVQKKVEKEVDGVPMVGYIDLVRDAQGSHRIVSDYKFTGRRPSQGAAEASMQLAYYADAEGPEVKAVDLIGLVRTKTPQVVTESAFVTPDMIRRTRLMIKQVWRSIRRMVFPFASPENEWGNSKSSVCNPDRCGYWHRCVGNPNGPEPIPGEVEV